MIAIISPSRSAPPIIPRRSAVGIIVIRISIITATIPIGIARIVPVIVPGITTTGSIIPVVPEEIEAKAKTQVNAGSRIGIVIIGPWIVIVETYINGVIKTKPYIRVVKATDAGSVIIIVVVNVLVRIIIIVNDLLAGCRRRVVIISVGLARIECIRVIIDVIKLGT
jgi:hypothetical protein